MADAVSERLEWLEADGLGGFASGTASGIRTRRYHALLLPAATPPTGRHVLVAGMDVTFESDGKSVALSSQRYAPGVIHPDGASRLLWFTNDPWPTWRYHVSDVIVIEQSLFVPKGLPITVLRWRSPQALPGSRLSVRLFLAGRDYHSMHHENAAFRFQAGVQSILATANAMYCADPDWYRRFLYLVDRTH